MTLSERKHWRRTLRAGCVRFGLGCLAVGLAGCGARGGQTGDEVAQSGSRALDGGKVHMVALGTEVAVTGVAGATTPGASVSVVNTRSGVQVSVSADDDGAFEATIAGRLGDEIEVSVGDAHVTRDVTESATAVQACSSESGCGDAAESSETTGTGTADGGAFDASSGGAVCGHLAARQAQEPSAGQCAGKFYLLGCARDDGSTSICLSDVTNACLDIDETFDSCESRCEAGEYAMACGGVNPMNEYEPAPEACRNAGVTPGGVSYYCCPCDG